ncbi:MAG: carbohydrate ABC transporter permease [Oscillospiraceae bacterium]|nr:carbohydrate ABC transporter permease [Oscillospiraceae bacterium]
MSKYAEYKRYTRSRAGNVAYFAFLFLMGAFSVLPLVYCVCTAFKPLDELLVFPPRFFVHRPTVENFTELPSLLEKLQVPLSRYLFNSVFIAVVTTVLHIFAASMAAYAFSKSKIKGLGIFFLVVQFSLLYNGTTLSIPQYLIFSQLHIINTFWVYILPAIPSSMGAFLMKQYMDSGIPDSLLEAAKIDGAGVFRIYWRIVMPITKPAWMTLLLFAFQGIWQTGPSAGTIFSEELKTLPYVMSSIAAGGTARAGSAMAATVILMIPPILVYFITQSNVMETMSSAGMKD